MHSLPEWVFALLVLKTEGILEHAMALVCFKHQLDNGIVRIPSCQVQKSILWKQNIQVHCHRGVLLFSIKLWVDLMQSSLTSSVAVTASMSLVNSAFSSRPCASGISMPSPLCSAFASSSAAMSRANAELEYQSWCKSWSSSRVCCMGEWSVCLIYSAEM